MCSWSVEASISHKNVFIFELQFNIISQSFKNFKPNGEKITISSDLYEWRVFSIFVSFKVSFFHILYSPRFRLFFVLVTILNFLRPIMGSPVSFHCSSELSLAYSTRACILSLDVRANSGTSLRGWKLPAQNKVSRPNRGWQKISYIFDTMRPDEQKSGNWVMFQIWYLKIFPRVGSVSYKNGKNRLRQKKWFILIRSVFFENKK